MPKTSKPKGMRYYSGLPYKRRVRVESDNDSTYFVHRMAVVISA